VSERSGCDSMRAADDEVRAGRIARSLGRLQQPLRSHAAVHGRTAALDAVHAAFRFNDADALLQEICAELLDVDYFDVRVVRKRLHAAFRRS
jgi:hypothetical protein